jgi:hypothetical protein
MSDPNFIQPPVSPEIFPTQEEIHALVSGLVEQLATQSVDESFDLGFAVIRRGIYQVPWFEGPVIHTHVIAEHEVILGDSDDGDDDVNNLKLTLTDSADTPSDNGSLCVTATNESLLVTAYGEEFTSDSQQALALSKATRLANWIKDNKHHLIEVNRSNEIL